MVLGTLSSGRPQDLPVDVPEHVYRWTQELLTFGFVAQAELAKHKYLFYLRLFPATSNCYILDAIKYSMINKANFILHMTRRPKIQSERYEGRREDQALALEKNAQRRDLMKK